MHGHGHTLNPFQAKAVKYFYQPQKTAVASFVPLAVETEVVLLNVDRAATCDNRVTQWFSPLQKPGLSFDICVCHKNINEATSL